MSDNESNGSAQERNEEIAALRRFVDSHPYPNYHTAAHIVLHTPQLGLPMDAEYGANNHYWLAEIYRKFDDKAAVKRLGTLIHNGGGMRALQMNYYALNYVVRDLVQNSTTASDYEKRQARALTSAYVNYGFEGIGAWKP